MRKLPSLSERRRALARINGAKSRGPVTATGKAHSSRNAIKHGLLRAGMPLLTVNEEDVVSLTNEVIAEFQLGSEIEYACARALAVASLRLDIVWNLQVPAFRQAFPSGDCCDCRPNHRPLILLMGYEGRCEREIHCALIQLSLLRRLANAAK